VHHKHHDHKWHRQSHHLAGDRFGRFGPGKQRAP
jgi:hypothetical protein